MGIVYVLTNDAMPGLVKIGMTDESDAGERIGKLYTTGVPLPFELEYACRTEDASDVEDALHVAFAPYRLNPSREFFRIEVDQAVAILRLLNKPDATADVARQPAGIDENSLAAAKQAKARRPNLNFEEMRIPIGSELQLQTNPDITVIVTAPKKVKIGEDEVSLSAATQQILGLEYQVRPCSVLDI